MFKIAIMGCGVVGSGVADILIRKSKDLSKSLNNDIELTYILDLRDLSNTPYASYAIKDADTILNDDSINAVVVTIGGLDFASGMCERALRRGKHVITSNKEVVAANGPMLTKLAYDNNVRFMYEASCGGGIPIIRPMNICLSANDIYEIQGILNGTTNYMLTGMYKDKLSFDDVLHDAQKKGYAEANPSADVDGYDAARKIAILSSIAYKKYVDYGKIQLRGIRDITYQDHELAATAGYVIKLIAGSRLYDDGIGISVEPKLVPNTNILSAVSSVYNAILLKGSFTGDSLFYGQGAGKFPTASAILGDIVETVYVPHMNALPEFVENNAVVLDQSNVTDRYYIRFCLNGCADDVYDDILLSLNSIFGDCISFIGASLSQSNVYAFLSGYLTNTSLSEKLSQLESVLNIRNLAYFKVLPD